MINDNKVYTKALIKFIQFKKVTYVRCLPLMSLYTSGIIVDLFPFKILLKIMLFFFKVQFAASSLYLIK